MPGSFHRRGPLSPERAWRAVLLFALLMGVSIRSARGAGPTALSLDLCIAAAFDDQAPGCDVNADGSTTAADIVAVIAAGGVPPLASPTPSPPSTDATDSPTATPTATASPTRTATPPPCPGAAVALVVEVDNQTGQASITIDLAGRRSDTACVPTGQLTAYNVQVSCSGTGVVTCAQINGLAPGSWRHSIHVIAPPTHQVEHQPSLVIADVAPNRIRFTAFAAVLTVQNAANEGAGSLRAALQAAPTAPKPLLIRFGTTAFPDGVQRVIRLAFALPAVDTDDITIDGTDALANAGNRVIDAAGLSIAALTITGARNHVVGMHLRNAGPNNADVLSITGPAADANVIERTIVEDAASADGVGVDQHAGKDFGATANVIRDCEISKAADKGVKVTLGAYARVEQSWVHDNVNGGIQATLGGHVATVQNLVERNRGGSAQNGLSANADDGGMPSDPSQLESQGDISRGNGANGVSVRAAAVATIADDYLATNGSSGIRVFNDVGPPASAAVSGTSAACNGADGAAVANASQADFGGGALGSAGNNAFTENHLPSDANLRNATGMPVSALYDQWQHCGGGTTCDAAAIAAYDLSDHGAMTAFVPAQPHRSQQPPMLTGTAPTKGAQNTLLRIFGSGFNVIDGHFSQDNCADLADRNRCVPLRGNCVRINGVPATVEAVTPTMLVVRWPFTCLQPVSLTVTTDQGAGGMTSAPLTVCTNPAATPASGQ